jgi:hypothetical protein
MREHVVAKGRPCLLCLADFLSLVLGYTRTRGSLYALQMVFGASHSFLSLFFKYSVRLLFKVLKEEEDGKVALPSVQEIAEYQEVDRSNFSCPG